MTVANSAATSLCVISDGQRRSTIGGLLDGCDTMVTLNTRSMLKIDTTILILRLHYNITSRRCHVLCSTNNLRPPVNAMFCLPAKSIPAKTAKHPATCNTVDCARKSMVPQRLDMLYDRETLQIFPDWTIVLAICDCGILHI